MPLPILPTWTSFMPGSMTTIYNMVANARNAAAARASASQQQPAFDPATLGNAPQAAGDWVQNAGRYGQGVTQATWGGWGPPALSGPPGGYPLPGGGNMANAAGDWVQNAARASTPFAMLQPSNIQGTFGTQRTAQLPDWLTGGTGAGWAALNPGGAVRKLIL